MDNKTFRLMSLRAKGHKNILEELSLYIENIIEENKYLREKLDNYNKDDSYRKNIYSRRTQ